MLPAIATLCLLVLLPQIVLAGPPSYYEQVQQELDHIRAVQLEEKKIEVLARLEKMNAPQTFISQSSNTSLNPYIKNSLTSSPKNTSTTEVTK